MQQMQQAETNLILVRGASGAGKSTVGELLESHAQCKILSTDDLFYIDGKYEFEKIMDKDPDMLRKNHQAIIDEVEVIMDDYDRMIRDTDYSWMPIDTVVVCNTFTELWEMEPYFELAAKHDWRVHTIVVENRHGSNSVHNVPAHVIQSQKERFEVVL